ncbi:hypothetical protein BDF20DRAFT_835287 [Mycotypha africana]|uniref:uncharacterized protein n=1 Tax=Mycotypha africana TaxID=64632 RepID=UPI002301B82A|nr:uncharacterized protein BDF20DRAFT_835287 [Mycotypha africana]KAI8979231.1 hypothetical protein BDF20DRAFT_835287 [Mycotypha africana]
MLCSMMMRPFTRKTDVHRERWMIEGIDRVHEPPQTLITFEKDVENSTQKCHDTQKSRPLYTVQYDRLKQSSRYDDERNVLALGIEKVVLCLCGSFIVFVRMRKKAF